MSVYATSDIAMEAKDEELYTIRATEMILAFQVLKTHKKDKTFRRVITKKGYPAPEESKAKAHIHYLHYLSFSVCQHV